MHEVDVLTFRAEDGLFGRVQRQSTERQSTERQSTERQSRWNKWKVTQTVSIHPLPPSMTAMEWDWAECVHGLTMAQQAARLGFANLYARQSLVENLTK